MNTDTRDQLDAAICRQTDPELWFPEVGGDHSQAKRLCRACPLVGPRHAYCLVAKTGVFAQRWENGSAPAGAANTKRGLTHSLDEPKEELAMHATPVCRTCGQPIARNPNWSKAHYATRQYCDRRCQNSARPDIQEDYVIDQRGCWVWQGPMDKNGYGKAYDPQRPLGRRVDWAHRVSFRRHRGPIPDGYELDHTCQNTACINPAHLDPVTKVEHARRTMQRLGKDAKHERAVVLRRLGMTYAEIAEVLSLSTESGAHSAVAAAIRKGLVDPDAVPVINRLDESDREDIRLLYALGVPQTEIGAWYGIDSSQVSRVCNGLTSGHKRAS